MLHKGENWAVCLDGCLSSIELSEIPGYRPSRSNLDDLRHKEDHSVKEPTENAFAFLGNQNCLACSLSIWCWAQSEDDMKMQHIRADSD